VIVDIQLARLRKMLADRKVRLLLDDKATQWLADAGYDPVYGARPLKRVIQRALQNPLSQLVLQGRILDGDIVEMTAGPDGLILEPIHPTESAAA
jgi:ATP-dependent Clp protease ATP-binding subunit ClpB